MSDKERLFKDRSAASELLFWGQRHDDAFAQALALARFKPTDQHWERKYKFGPKGYTKLDKETLLEVVLQEARQRGLA